MNLNELSENDLNFTLEDKNTGFATEIELINDSESTILNGSFNLTHKFIDPATGLLIISQNPTVVLRISSVQSKIDAGDISSFPDRNWLVNVNYLNKDYNLFVQSPPKFDNRLGIIILILSNKN